MSVPPGRRPPLRKVIVALALLTVGLFAAGVVYGYVHGQSSPCGKQDPLRSRPGILGQTEYVCPDGRTVTD